MTSSAPLIFGEVLFDCFPDGREVPGGAPFNIAWNLQAFGLSPLFISRVGDDHQGRQIAELMENWSMATAGLQVDPQLPTGRVEVTLQEGEPRFTILPAQAYDRIDFRLPEDLVNPCFLYHGSLALRDDTARTTFARIKEQLSCPIFVDVNLRDPWWNRELIFSLLADTTWLKLNEHELHTLFPAGETIEQCSMEALERFNLNVIFITLGSRGALAMTADGRRFSVAPTKSFPVTDTVGAGDAFASVLLVGLERNWPLPTIMERAQVFASAVVCRRGATTQERVFYAAIREQWS